MSIQWVSRTVESQDEERILKSHCVVADYLELPTKMNFLHHNSAMREVEELLHEYSSKHNLSRHLLLLPRLSQPRGLQELPPCSLLPTVPSTAVRAILSTPKLYVCSQHSRGFLSHQGQSPSPSNEGRSGPNVTRVLVREATLAVAPTAPAEPSRGAETRWSLLSL